MGTRTIGPGQTHTTLAGWVSYLIGTPLTENEIGEVTGTTVDTVFVSVTGWTANGFSVTLRAKAGESVRDGGRLYWLTSGRAILRNTVVTDRAYQFANMTVLGLQIEATDATSTTAVECSTGALIDSCIIRHAGNTGQASVVKDTSNPGIVRSSVLIATASEGVRSAAIPGLTLQNCLILGTNAAGRIGVTSLYATAITMVNTIVYNFATNFGGAAPNAASSNNATSKATFEVAGYGSTAGQVSLTSADFVDVGTGTEDYRIASGSTKLRNTGATISGRTLDIFGTAVPQSTSPDIGPHEFPAADTTAPDITSTGTGSTNGPFAANLAENSTAAAITLTANETVTWGTLGGADAALFNKINETGTTVQLAPVSSFNFESLPHANPFVVTISATDASTNSRTVTVNFTVTNVSEPPNAPTIGTATAGNAQATVTFSAPTANGGPSVTSYTVTSSPGGLTATGSNSPITVTGLTNGVAYTFTVTATNSEGTSSASAASNSVTPTGVQGTITTPVLKNISGTVLANLTGVVANVYNPTTGALVVRKTGLTSNGSGVVTIQDASIAIGTTYVYEIDLSGSSLGRRLPSATAA